MTDKEILKIAIDTITIETQTLQNIVQNLDSTFVEIVKHLNSSQGRIVVSGIGKSALIGQKITATFNSIGCPSLFMHAADALHGDLGMIRPEDTIIILSKSGETQEIKDLITYLKNLPNTKIALTANPESFLGMRCNYILHTPIAREADPNNLAPTASTIAQLAMGDALATALIGLKKFTPEDFAHFHPGGSLGKKLLLRVGDLIPNFQLKPMVCKGTPLAEVLQNMSDHRKGATVVIDDGHILGIITDGDIRRMLMNKGFDPKICAEQIMSKNPKTVDSNLQALKALEILEQYDISQLIVLENNDYFGIVHIHDILDEGLNQK